MQRRLQRARKKEDVRIFVETQASHRSQLRTAQLDDFAHVLALGIDVRAPAETPEQLREQVQAWQQFSRYGTVRDLGLRREQDWSFPSPKQSLCGR